MPFLLSARRKIPIFLLITVKGVGSIPRAAPVLRGPLSRLAWWIETYSAYEIVRHQEGFQPGVAAGEGSVGKMRQSDAKPVVIVEVPGDLDLGTEFKRVAEIDPPALMKKSACKPESDSQRIQER